MLQCGAVFFSASQRVAVCCSVLQCVAGCCSVLQLGTNAQHLYEYLLERGSEYILAHTGKRELDGHPLGGRGLGFGLVPGYTTLSVRVRANT